MLEKKIIKLVPEVKKKVFFIIISQIIAMLSNVFIIYNLLNLIFINFSIHYILLILVLLTIRIFINRIIEKISGQIASLVKLRLRSLFFKKLLITNNLKLNKAELTQLSIEGIEQLEIYFSKYLPQLFYSLIAPILLFIIIYKYNFTIALFLLICVPLIPITIILVQKIAKKLLNKYWLKYTSLGDHFNDNLQGINLLKLYGSDQHYLQEMNVEAQKFRKITMRVLIMQLNSISVMDLITYGCSALGSIMAIQAYLNQTMSLSIMCFIILISSEFFLPMRLLGSYFHIAMNGISASARLSKFFETPKQNGLKNINQIENIEIKNLNYKNILKDINLSINKHDYIGIIGPTGSGKSTIAKIISGLIVDYQGTVLVNNINLKDIDLENYYHQIAYIDNNPLLFSGTILENFAPITTDEKQIISILTKLKLWENFKKRGGLHFKILEQGKNLSGGQRQRLYLAMYLLANKDIYIFDEATANIDQKSEKIIVNMIEQLAEDKIVICIAHRLSNLINCSKIYHINNGIIFYGDNHQNLLSIDEQYKNMYLQQEKLENNWRINE